MISYLPIHGKSIINKEEGEQMATKKINIHRLGMVARSGRELSETPGLIRVRDPKVQKLSPAQFKHWINILCIANSNRDTGELPSVDDIAFALRIKPSEVQNILSHLLEKGLLDKRDDGSFSPHNWTERQRNSDVGAARQQRYREKNKQNNSKLPEKVTSLSRNGDALEVEVEVDKKIKSDLFESLWKAYPRKDGRREAERHYFATVKNDADMKRINLALGKYLAEIASNATERRYIKTGKVWFNNWQDWEHWTPPTALTLAESSSYQGDETERLRRDGLI
jgi:DNA-binding transcriptional regulator YhcF (GntR family)